MIFVDLPMTSGNTVTLCINNGNVAIHDSSKMPGMCYVIDGCHNNGGWQIAMTRAQVVALIKEASS